MKKKEIGVGRYYTNCKKGLREVTAQGPGGSGSHEDYVRYRTYGLYGSNGADVPVQHTSSLQRFAEWAKAELSPEEVYRKQLELNARVIGISLSRRARSFLQAFGSGMTMLSPVLMCDEDDHLIIELDEKDLLDEIAPTFSLLGTEAKSGWDEEDQDQYHDIEMRMGFGNHIIYFSDLGFAVLEYLQANSQKA